MLKEHYIKSMLKLGLDVDSALCAFWESGWGHNKEK
jgi:hypothetical protein